MASSQKTVKVNIFGIEYVIKGDLDISYIQSVAKYVNDKMEETESEMSSKSVAKVAVVTALNIADELFRLQEEKTRLIQNLEGHVRRLTKRIDEEIQFLKSPTVPNNNGRE